MTELCDTAEMRCESEYRERLYRDLYPAGTPDYMLKDRAYPTQTYRARLLVCAACGTVARDPQLSVDAARGAYAGDSYHPGWLESSYREFRAVFLERMPALVAWVGRDARVLEVGSFVGGFLAAARVHGWRSEGVDVGACVVAFARLQGLEVTEATLCEAGFPACAFDAVFVWSCFDRLPEPRRELAEIHRVLKPDGRLLLRVPNGGFVTWMQRLRRSVPALEDRVRRTLALTGLASFPFQGGYTRSGLTAILRDSGFASIRVSNRANLRGSNPARRSFWNLPQGARTPARVQAASELVRRITLGRVVLGPWIEVASRKAERGEPATRTLSSRDAVAVPGTATTPAWPAASSARWSSRD